MKINFLMEDREFHTGDGNTPELFLERDKAMDCIMIGK
jgi:hypothetical protein